MNRLAIYLTAILMGSAAPAFGGEVTRENIGANFEWKSTECARPSRPYPQRNDPTRIAQLQEFTLKVAYYLDCLKGEAQRDFDRAQLEMHKAIQSELQAETDKMNDAVEQVVTQ